MLGPGTTSSADPMGWDSAAFADASQWPDLEGLTGAAEEDPDDFESGLLLHKPISSPGRGIAASFGLSGELGHEYAAAVPCLYASHALARWAWRTWEFAVALILMKLYPSSLLLVSAYGLLDNLTRLMLGSLAGQFIDRSDRLKGAISCYGVQNICITASAAAAGLLVWFSEHNPQGLTKPVYWLLLSTTVVAGASSSVGSLGAAVAVEREYPKTLCGQDTAALSKVNSVMRAIDLSCQMLAPVAAGFLMTYASMLVAIAVLGLYCLAVWLPECMLLHAAHARSTLLRQPKALHSVTGPSKPHPCSILLGCTGWSTYFQQTTLLAGLALALLYLTVLSLGFLMTSYLAWRGMSEATLSLFRAAGALSGLAATALFHPLKRCMGLLVAGCCGIGWQLLCLMMGVTPVVIAHVVAWQELAGGQHSGIAGFSSSNTNSTLLHSNGTAYNSSAVGGIGQGQGMGPAAAAVNAAANSTVQAAAAAGGAGGPAALLLYVLLSGLVASRLGLWLFDLAVCQLQQELVPSHQLGTVSGVQASIQSFFEILSFIAGCIANRPEQFHWLMAGSCCAVAAAAGLYLVFVCRGGGTAGGSGGPTIGAGVSVFQHVGGTQQPAAMPGGVALYGRLESVDSVAGAVELSKPQQ